MKHFKGYQKGYICKENTAPVIKNSFLVKKQTTSCQERTNSNEMNFTALQKANRATMEHRLNPHELMKRNVDEMLVLNNKERKNVGQ